MTASQRPAVIAGNWKMYKTAEETADFIKQLAPLVVDAHPSVFLAVPFTAIRLASELAKEHNIVVGAQNMNDASEGAFTGEIAAKMLVDAGAKFVIVGHSERRQIFKEDDAFINRKIKRALESNLIPILCVGETLEEHEAGKTEDVIKYQLSHGLDGITREQMPNVIVAYEPLWAIGTGKTATPEAAQEIHHLCRSHLAETWSQEVAEQVVLMYGGSVKPSNARALMGQKDIDGLLVGGASLSVESFSQIVNYQNALTY